MDREFLKSVRRIQGKGLPVLNRNVSVAKLSNAARTANIINFFRSRLLKRFICVQNHFPYLPVKKGPH